MSALVECSGARGSIWTASPLLQPRLLGFLATSIVILNVLDACLTLVWVRAGIAVEANVLLRALVETNPLAFVAVKLLVVTAGVRVLQRFSSRPLAIVGLLLSFTVYALLLGYHGFIAVYGW